MTEPEKIKKRGRPNKTEKAVREGKQTTLSNFFKDEKSILIEEIIIEVRKRSQYSEDKVNQLAESIQDVGLMNPIVITEDKRLVAGYHRILAFKKLERSEIPYRMTTLKNPLKLELQEIDENLIRGELIALEECEQLLRRKQIYEKLHPETKQSEHLKYYSRDSKGRITKDEKNSPLAKKHFTKELAEKMNLSQRTIQNKIKTAIGIIPSLKDVIRDTKLANRKTDLMKISKYSQDFQNELLETINRMKLENLEIEKLVLIEAQHNLYENEKQTEINYHIIKNQGKKLQGVITHLQDELNFYDFEAFQDVQDEKGRIDWKNYLELQKTALWRKGKKLRFLLNEVLGLKQPKWEDTRLHHENPYPWEHLFSKGYIIHKNSHKKGGNLLNKDKKEGHVEID